MRTVKFKIISGVLLLLILTLLFGIVLYRSYLKINRSLYGDGSYRPHATLTAAFSCLFLPADSKRPSLRTSPCLIL